MCVAAATQERAFYSPLLAPFIRLPAVPGRELLQLPGRLPQVHAVLHRQRPNALPGQRQMPDGEPCAWVLRSAEPPGGSCVQRTLPWPGQRPLIDLLAAHPAAAWQQRPSALTCLLLCLPPARSATCPAAPSARCCPAALCASSAWTATRRSTPTSLASSPPAPSSSR